MVVWVHDCIELDGERYVHITDAGKMTEEALEYCKSAPSVTIEANYDPEMLANGPYPPDLQKRIRGGHGHISNNECAEAAEFFIANGTKRFILGHLSPHNNTEEIAAETFVSFLADKGLVRDMDYELRIAKKSEPTEGYVL